MSGFKSKLKAVVSSPLAMGILIVLLLSAAALAFHKNTTTANLAWHFGKGPEKPDPSEKIDDSHIALFADSDVLGVFKNQERKRWPAAYGLAPTSVVPSPSPSPSPSPLFGELTSRSLQPTSSGLNLARSPASLQGGGGGSGSRANGGMSSFSASGPVNLGLDLGGNRFWLNINCSVGSSCPLVDKMWAAVGKNVNQIIEQYYQGQQPDPAGGSASGASTQVPICDRTATDTQNAETSNNHLNQSCGKSMCTTLPLPTGLDLKTCALERSWARGEMINDVMIAMEQVKYEFTVAHIVQIGATCQSIQSDPDFQFDVGTFNSYAELFGNNSLGQMITCDINPTDPVVGAGALMPRGFYINDRVIPVQAACQYNAGMNQIWASFAHISECEIFSRADLLWSGQTYPQINTVIGDAIYKAATSCNDTGCINQVYQNTVQGNWSSISNGTASTLNLHHFLLTCPKGASDCKCDDLTFCGSGTPFARAQLSAVGSAVTELKSAEAQIEALKPYVSTTLPGILGVVPRPGSNSCQNTQ